MVISTHWVETLVRWVWTDYLFFQLNKFYFQNNRDFLGFYIRENQTGSLFALDWSGGKVRGKGLKYVQQSTFLHSTSQHIQFSFIVNCSVQSFNSFFAINHFFSQLNTHFALHSRLFCFAFCHLSFHTLTFYLLFQEPEHY